MPRPLRNPATRFWKLVNADGGCWVWKGQLCNGYGQFSVKREGAFRKVMAHRFSFEMASGEAIPKGKIVCHACDNPACVNPAHLWLGTQKENIADAIRKGRRPPECYSRKESCPRGEANTQSRLTTEQVLQIRSLHAAGMKQIDIAPRFGVSQAAISKIVLREAWTHI